VAAKWLELLKQIAPRVTRVAVVRAATISSAIGFLGALQTAAPSLGVEWIPIAVRDAGAVERDVTAFVRGPNDGMIVLPSASAGAPLRDLTIGLAARHGPPAVYPVRRYVTRGGLISYAPDNTVEPYRLAAHYVDRILKGEKPADLPVQGCLNCREGRRSSSECSPARPKTRWIGHDCRAWPR